MTLDELARAVGYAPHHFHRLFKRATGVTPGRLCPRRCGRGAPPTALDAEESVTERDLRGRLFRAEPLLRDRATPGWA